jgi:superfamily II DNA helicase RecQ
MHWTVLRSVDIPVPPFSDVDSISNLPKTPQLSRRVESASRNLSPIPPLSISPLADKLLEKMIPFLSSQSASDSLHPVSQGPSSQHFIQSFSSTIVTEIPTPLLRAMASLGRMSFKNEAQAAAVKLFYSRQSDILIVMPTGGGKSFIYQAVAASFSKNEFIVVVLPFQALAMDQCAAARRLGIDAVVYDPLDERPMLSPLVFVVTETAINSSFQSFLRRSNSLSFLFTIVIDEGHLFLSPELSRFRPAFQKLPTFLGQFDCPVVVMSGSLPPQDEDRMRRSLNRPDSMRVFRQPCIRRNISYNIDKTLLDWADPDGLVHYVWEISKTTIELGGRALIFMPTKEIISQMMDSRHAKLVHFSYITADLSGDQQADTLANWGILGNRCILLSTSVVGTGVDLACVRLVAHTYQPSSMRDWFQQTGRGGRDGKDSRAILNTTKPPWREFPEFPEDTVDRGVLDAVIEATGCRRELIDAYMDGSASSCLAACAVLCDFCHGLVNSLKGTPIITPSLNASSSSTVALPSIPHQAIPAEQSDQDEYWDYIEDDINLPSDGMF